MPATTPKISIITVTLNPGSKFEETARSILEQDFPGMEWIVIDGGSTDGTIDQIRKYDNRIACWKSERDLGVYDAMNKGIMMATGEWVNFMNAGDNFASPATVSGIFAGDLSALDVVYGDCLIRYPKTIIMKKAGDPDAITRGMVLCHQSVFSRRSLLLKHPFNLKYRIGADYHQIACLAMEGAGILHIPVPVAIYDIEGDSNRRMVDSAREHYHIAKSVFSLTPSEKWSHLMFIAKVRVIAFFYKIFPANFVAWLKIRLPSIIFHPVNPEKR